MRNNEIVIVFKVKLVQEFFKMREIFNSQPQETQTDRELKGLKASIEILRVNEASKILMTKTLYKDLGLNTNYLPAYSDENHTYSLSHLLEKFEVGLSARNFNEILLSNGILEVKTRKSTNS
jgi:hypothetical protein